MSETNGHAPEPPLCQLAGHLVIYRLPDGGGLLCFRPDGAGEDAIVRQPVPIFMVGPLVAALSGGTPDVSGIPGAGLIQKVMMRGG